METFSIELNEISHKRSKLIRLWIVGAVILIASIFLSFLLIGDDFKKLAVVLPLLIQVSIYIYFAYVTYNARIFIQSDSYALEYKFGLVSKMPKSIIWETVKKIKFGPTYISFNKKSGKKVTISLGWLPYAKLKEIKEKVYQVAQSKSIPCEWAEFKKYS
ncbi:hypothetical protein [Tenuifilum thalassicum]|uniref:Uncharacterized protein n=1 Tax=Tenuifilum thalassicum TaxID=2590900 RepID=A0A7D4CQH2_9BACT|nr:hypothetical protein [Tenuifilum thalassicum]QKG79405.1 hypothetical protein FHG85_03705 [Tenuifilum thalassicum]